MKRAGSEAYEAWSGDIERQMRGVGRRVDGYGCCILHVAFALGASVVSGAQGRGMVFLSRRLPQFWEQSGLVRRQGSRRTWLLLKVDSSSHTELFPTAPHHDTIEFAFVSLGIL